MKSAEVTLLWKGNTKKYKVIKTSGAQKEPSITYVPEFTFSDLRPGFNYEFNVLAIDRYETESNPQSRSQLDLTDFISMQSELQRSLKVKRAAGSALVTWQVNLNPRHPLRRWVVQYGTGQKEIYTTRTGYLNQSP